MRSRDPAWVKKVLATLKITVFITQNVLKAISDEILETAHEELENLKRNLPEGHISRAPDWARQPCAGYFSRTE